jgi:glycosyltransferase involved in cell wall biosynthesis
MSDVLVFPSEREPYGLSAREAICVGLPLIVSDQLGCIGPLDAARPDFNALVYPSLNVDLLAKAIIRLASNPQKIIEMSQASLRIAYDIREDVSVDGFINAVQNTSKIENKPS